MAVQSVTSGSTASYATGMSGSSAAELGQEFMQLLITQIQNQDPFNPMDNTEFIGQLTQLSSLEQLQSMNETLSSALTVNQSVNNSMLIDLVGRKATVAGDGLTVETGAVPKSSLMTETSGSATVTVRDEDGQVVATYQRALTAGHNDISWDGRLADGTLAADGNYTMTVSAVDRAGTAIDNTLYQTGVVESIRFEDNVAIVTIGGRDYYVSEIAQVSR